MKKVLFIDHYYEDQIVLGLNAIFPVSLENPLPFLHETVMGMDEATKVLKARRDEFSIAIADKFMDGSSLAGRTVADVVADLGGIIELADFIYENNLPCKILVLDKMVTMLDEQREAYKKHPAILDAFGKMYSDGYEYKAEFREVLMNALKES